MNSSLMTTSEVATYLRLKERKIYDLVSQGLIPCTKVTGKLLFPRQAIDLWLMNHLEGDQRTSSPVPAILAGSQDPLLEWALREANTDLALLCHGSGDGIKRLISGRAMIAGMHLLDDSGEHYNDPVRLGLGGMRDLVVIHWAWRSQGLLVAPGNPEQLTGLRDLAATGIRVGHRQPDAGAETLFRHLLTRAGIAREALTLLPHPALTEDDLALDVREGRADAGLGVEAAARRHGLDFIPLHRERFDLAMRRRSYFEPTIQQLFTFARTERFCERADAMGGYDIRKLGDVMYNA
ncbi:MAG: helix-turn-helix transcriptional regulator [Ectothiorhodospiraceae bacterium]|nr:helix-turn-helix transcriptional regulator [Ectothiorhodospiraceae bacterium]